MIAARSVLQGIPKAKCIMQQTRNFNNAYSVVSGPPTVQISTAEKLVHGLAIAAGMLTIPTWVLLHMKEYKGEK